MNDKTEPDETDQTEDGEQTAASNTEADEGYEEARALVEDALDAYAQGDEKRGDELIDEAKRFNAAAVADVYQELEEDADSQHDLSKIGASEGEADEAGDEEGEDSEDEANPDDDRT